jgi:hypothetical protein
MTQHQEVDIKGKFWINRVSVKPTWTAKDEGRVIYAMDSHTLWLGTNAAWTEIADSTLYADLTLYPRLAANNFYAGSQYPSTTNTRYLGWSTLRWNTVYATTLNGSAVTATYADLAEKYTAPERYTKGTVVEVSKTVGFDVWTADRHSEYVVGVVSESPGFTMNNQSPGQSIGICGRVPVRCMGPVNKRDWIVSAGNGLGEAGEKMYRFAIALETNDSHDEKLVECLLKL